MAFGDSTLSLNIGLPSFSPTSGYPGLDLYRYAYLIRAVQNCLHPFDHRILRPGLCGRCLLCVALDDRLVVADEYRLGPVSTRPYAPLCRA
jgi:hypothetical protein